MNVTVLAGILVFDFEFFTGAQFQQKDVNKADTLQDSSESRGDTRPLICDGYHLTGSQTVIFGSSRLFQA